MRSGEFRRMLDGTSTDQTEPPIEVGDLDGWFRYFGVSKEEPEETDE
jgi:hypothetical protein